MSAKRSMEYAGLGLPGATKQATALKDTAADRARRHVASSATGPADCALLLEALGLVPAGKKLAVRVP